MSGTYFLYIIFFAVLIMAFVAPFLLPVHRHNFRFSLTALIFAFQTVVAAEHAAKVR